MKTLASGLLTLVLASACSAHVQNPVPPLASLGVTPTAMAGAVRPHGARAAYIYFGGLNDVHPPSGVIGAYPATANGNVAPVRAIGGPQTQFDIPENAVPDATGRLWTCGLRTNKILAFPAGAAGNVTPSVVIAGSNVLISGCLDIALGSDGTVYATSYYAPMVAAWAPGSSGNVSPSKVYAGSNTGIVSPAALALAGGGGLLYVSNLSPASVEVFNLSLGTNAAPIRKIAGSNTRLSYPYGIAVDPATNRLWVANERTNTIEAFGPVANGNRLPLDIIAGSNTQIQSPFGIAVDDAGYVYVGNCPQYAGATGGSIVVFAPGAHGNVKPVQIIKGSNTFLSCVAQITVR